MSVVLLLRTYSNRPAIPAFVARARRLSPNRHFFSQLPFSPLDQLYPGASLRLVGLPLSGFVPSRPPPRATSRPPRPGAFHDSSRPTPPPRCDGDHRPRHPRIGRRSQTGLVR